MKTFKDKSGREWKVEINCLNLARVYDIAKVDLGEPGDQADGDIPLYVRLISGMGLFFKVLPILCMDQIEARGMNSSGFLEEINPKNLPKIKQDFVEEWADFFQSSGQPSFKKVLMAMLQYHQTKTKLGPDSPQVKKLEALLTMASQESSQPATTQPESAE